jgi:hypothetical protein
MITATTTLTSSLPLVLIPLPSGAQGAIIYSATFGEVVNGVLLAMLLAVSLIQMWRVRR